MTPKKRKAIQEELSKSNACYVLITCQKAEANGQMQVEMSYEGDPALAAYLLQGAQNFLENEEEESKLSCN